MITQKEADIMNNMVGKSKNIPENPYTPQAYEDETNKPNHYTWHPSGVEAKTIAEAFEYHIGTAIVYLWRHAHKGTPIEDLRKAIGHIEFQIEKLSGIRKQAETKINLYEKIKKDENHIINQYLKEQEELDNLKYPVILAVDNKNYFSCKKKIPSTSDNKIIIYRWVTDTNTMMQIGFFSLESFTFNYILPAYQSDSSYYWRPEK